MPLHRALHDPSNITKYFYNDNGGSNKIEINKLFASTKTLFCFFTIIINVNFS